MSIPEFGNGGLLPTGPSFASWENELVFSGHACSLAEVEDRLVQSFPQSIERPALFNELRRLMDQALLLFNCVILIVSGEFVTETSSPHDIFVALDAPGETLDQLDAHDLWLLDWIFNSQERIWGDSDELRVQTGLVPAYPRGHRKHQAGNSERMLQRHLASSPVPDSSYAGYLEVVQCEGGLRALDEIFAAPSEGSESASGD